MLNTVAHYAENKPLEENLLEFGYAEQRVAKIELLQAELGN